MSRRNCFLSREVCLRRRSRHPVRHGIDRRRRVKRSLRGLSRAKPHVTRQVVAEVDLGVSTQRLNLLDLRVAGDLVELAQFSRLTGEPLGVGHGKGTDLISLRRGIHALLVSRRYRLHASLLGVGPGRIDHDLVLNVLLREFGLRDHDKLLVLHLLSSKLALEISCLNRSFGLLLDSDTKGCLLHESLLRLLLSELKALLPDHIGNNDVGDAHPVDQDTRINFAYLSLDFGHQVVVEVAEVSDLDFIDRAVRAQLSHVLAERVKNQHGVVFEAVLGDCLGDFLRVDAVGDFDARNVDIDALLGHAAHVVRDVSVLNGLDVVDDGGQWVVELDARIHLWVNLAPVHVHADVAARDGRVERVGRRDGRKHQRAHQR